jgi:hypothetical protein
MIGFPSCVCVMGRDWKEWMVGGKERGKEGGREGRGRGGKGVEVEGEGEGDG